MENQLSPNQPDKDSTASTTFADPKVSDIFSDMRERRERTSERLKSNRLRIHKALKKVGATRAVITYNGSGDEGQINEVTIYKEEKVIHSEKKIYVFVASSYWQNGSFIEHTKRRSMKLGEALEQLVYDWSEFEHRGWENNDGASGECNIEVAEDKFTLDHHTYYTESETETHLL